MGKCAVCGSKNATVLIKVSGFTYLQCASCGYAYIDELDWSQQEGRYSTPEYEQARINAESKHIDYYERLSKLILGFVPSSSRILDVGCGAGFLLRELNSVGYNALGVDLGEIRAKHGREQLGVDIVNRDFFELNQRVNAISMQQFIEHVPNPLDFFSYAGKLLPSGGGLVVGTPNLTPAVFLARLPKPLGPVLGDALGHPPNHCGLFGQNALGLALEKTGFDLRKVINNPTGFMGHSALRRAADRGFSRLNVVGINMLVFAVKR